MNATAGPTPEFGQKHGLFVAAWCVLVAFRSEVFFTGMGISGQTFLGSEESPYYLVFTGAVALIVYAIAFRFLRTSRMEGRQIGILLLPLFLVVAYLVSETLGLLEAKSGHQLSMAIAFACPAAVAGMISAQERVRRHVAKAVECLMLILTSGAALAGLSGLSGSPERGVGGATYQTVAYMGALAFIINGYMILMGNTLERLRFMRSGSYRLLSYILLPIQVVTVLLSGGRGGFILLLAGVLVLMGLAVAYGRFAGAPRRLVLASLLLILAIVWVLPKLKANATASPRLARLLSYVGEDSIDWSGTSGRADVYQNAITTISDSPAFGHGLFSWGADSYPHNLALELLLNGGPLYLVAWAWLTVHLTCKVLRLARTDATTLIIVPLALHPLVMLQFSGTYWAQGPLWFALGFAVSLHVPGTVRSQAGPAYPLPALRNQGCR